MLLRVDRSAALIAGGAIPEFPIGSAEIEGVLKPGFRGDLLYAESTFAQKMPRGAHPERRQVLIRALADLFAKQIAEIVGVQLELLLQFGKSARFHVVRL